jgi:hypothetical protein
MAFPLSTYESILRGAAAYGGVKVTQLLNDTASLLFEYVNVAYREWTEADWWPEVTTTELRYWRDGLWSAGTYPDGTIIYDATTEKYWKNATGGSTTDTPSDTVTNDWTDPGDFARYVSFCQMTGTNLATSETEIDAVKNFFQSDPDQNPLKGDSAFEITENGAAPLSYDYDKVYIRFKKRPDDMSGMVEWDSTATYVVGDYVYYEGSTTPLAGEAYKVIVATSAGEDPQDTPASFQKVEIPYRASTFIKRKALADWLSAGGGGTALGDTASSVQLASFNNARAAEALEKESFNLRARSGQYGHYNKRIV